MGKKFTPGPWKPHHRMKECVTFKGEHGEENLFLKNVDGYYACQNEYDANLISAAPDLLEALEVIRDTPEFKNLWSDTKQKVLQAIAKAYGD